MRTILKALLLAMLVLPAAFDASAQPRTGGLLFLGTWPRVILVIDEAQGRVIDQVQLQTGTPRDLTLSYDRKKVYVTTWSNGIEVIDIATRKVINAFTLGGGGLPARTSAAGITPDPTDQFLYTTVQVVEKKADRFEVGKPKFAVVDLAQKKITKTFEFPKEHEGPFGFAAGMRVSPDGKLLYVFKEDVLIFDLAEFKQVDKIELSKPPHPGALTVRLGGGDDPNEEPGVVTSVFNATDPVARRPIFGIARLELASRKLDFTPVGPAITGMTGLRLTPDRRTGYTVAYLGGNRVEPTRRTEFWVFDIASHKLVKKHEFESRSRFFFALSSDGRKIYIYGAGPTIEVFDAQTFARERVLTFDGDITTQMLVVRPSS